MALKMATLAGSGKSAGGRPAKEAPDSLRSKSYARIIDLLSEGEIEGFVDENGRKLIDAYLTSQPTVVGGVVQNDAVLGYGGSGYTVASTGPSSYSGSLFLDITDPSGEGSGAKARLTVSDGVITSVLVIDGGKNYVSAEIPIPYAIGKSIFLDDQPLQNPGMTYNFNSLKLDFRPGTQDQALISGFNAVEQTIQVNGGEVKWGAPVSRTIHDKTADVALIGIKLDSLYKQNKKTGDIEPTSITYRVTVTYYGDNYTGPETQVAYAAVNGKTSSPYIRTVPVSLRQFKKARPLDTNPGYKFTVYRMTEDRTGMEYSDTMYFDFFTMVTESALTYPNSALVGIQLDAESFTRVPTRAYRLKLLKVKVPTNYFPATRLYNRSHLGISATGTPRDEPSPQKRTEVSGKTKISPSREPSTVTPPVTPPLPTYTVPPGGAVYDIYGAPVHQEWDGTFYTAWSDNPAWVLYDIATNERYGAGEYLNSNMGSIDKWALYQIAQYCDELVDDGYGGKEPRFTCNTYIQSREDAYKVLNDLASVFRGALYWSSGAVIPVQDRPVASNQIVANFTNANVKDGLFNYSSSGRRARHTVAIVQYNDPKDFYRAKVEYVEDYPGILRYGRNEVEVTAFGTASRGQAYRVGRSILATDLYTPETVTFTTSLEGIYLRPFDVIRVYDKNRAGVDYAGRILSISADRIYVETDSVKELPNAQAPYSMLLANPTPYVPEGDATSEAEQAKVRASQLIRISVRGISYNSSGRLTIKLAEPVPESVKAGNIWGIELTAVSPKLFRIVGISEQAPNEFEVSATEYDTDKYNLIDKAAAFDATNYTVITLKPDAPSSLRFTPSNVTIDGAVVLKVLVSWSAPLTPVKGYAVYVKQEFGSYQLLTTTPGLSYDFYVSQDGLYTFQIFSIGVTGEYSASPAEGSIVVSDDGTAINEESSRVEQVSGLELYEQATNTIFQGADAHFVWRRNSATNSYEFGSEPFGANSGTLSDDFQGYSVIIRDPTIPDDPDTPQEEGVIYKTMVTDPRFVFTYEMNKQTSLIRRDIDTGLPYPFPYRSFIFEVRYVNKLNQVTEPQSLLVENPRPSVPVATITTLTGKAIVTFPFSVNADFAGYRVWAHQTSNFIPDSSTYNDVGGIPHAAPVYSGNANPVILDLAAGTWYIYYAEFDVFGQEVMDCELSAKQTTVVP